MKLRFYAREDLLVNDPERPVITGQSVPRIGRKFVAAKKDEKGNVTAPASEPSVKDAHEVEAGSEAGNKLAKQCSRGVLWPADAPTAEACNVPFVPLKFDDGAWVPAGSKSASSAAETAAGVK